jgi:hypothetical protein
MTIINPLIENHSNQINHLNNVTKSNTEQIASNTARISTCENNIDTIYERHAQADTHQAAWAGQRITTNQHRVFRFSE